jgi:tetratricopeptide (TPR) repeat protein
VKEETRNNMILIGISSLLFVFILIKVINSDSFNPGSSKKTEEINLNDAKLVTDEAIRAIKSKQTQKAGKLFKRALELEPNNPNYLYNYGLFTRQSGGDINLALEYFNKSIKVSNSQYLSPIYEKAKILTLQKKYTEAGKAILKAIDLAPERGDLRGLKKVIEDNVAKEKEELLEIVKKNP